MERLGGTPSTNQATGRQSTWPRPVFCARRQDDRPLQGGLCGRTRAPDKADYLQPVLANLFGRPAEILMRNMAASAAKRHQADHWVGGSCALKRERRVRRRGKSSNGSYREVDVKAGQRRDSQMILMGLAIGLALEGGLWLLSSIQQAARVRRLSNSAILSASALRESAPGQAVILRGAIDPQTANSAWGLVIYDRERYENTVRPAGRLGSVVGPSRWMPSGPSHRPPFTLVTNEGRIPIKGGHYVIERPTDQRELGRQRYSGFRSGDQVLVVGTSAKGGIAAAEVFGGTRAQFRRTLEEQRDLSVTGRRIGFLLIGLGVMLLPPWALLEIRWRLRARQVTSDT
jgi:hypothetical protein